MCKKPEPVLETCNYCGGRGWLYGSVYDAYGYQRFDEPPQLTCQYCNGSGQCADGSRLLPADPPRRDQPPWTPWEN